MSAAASRWPKNMPQMTPEQEAIRDDWMRYWHEVLPNRYGLLEKFNHGYPRARDVDRPNGLIRTLEIGAGLGAHIGFEDLSFQEYTALELRDNMAQRIKEVYPQVKTLVGDVQEYIPAPDRYFDRVVAVHVLEHLPNLPKALVEIRRVMKPGGQFAIVIPCEGGMMYELARRVSSKRLFEKRYNISYDWCIKSEHVNTYGEIVDELRKQFVLGRVRPFPFGLPSMHLNLVVGLTGKPRK